MKFEVSRTTSLSNLKIFVLTFLASSVLLETSSFAASTVKNPCEPSEKWTLSSSIEEDWSEDDVKDFESFISGSVDPLQAFSDGLALRTKSTVSEGRLLAEYWMARALYKSGMVHLAHQGFSAIAAKPVKKDRTQIQAAALGCLVQIHLNTPALGLDPAVVARLAELPASPQVWDAASLELRFALAEDSVSKNRVDGLLKVLNGSGNQEALGLALVDHRNGKYRSAIAHFKKAFSPEQNLRPVDRAIENHLRVQFARSLFSAGIYDQSVEQYKLVARSSNELANSLSELSWAYLQGERYTEAIGTAVSLQAGGLRHTFTPEAYMVMAMALNEICQYPESVRAIGSFRKNYEKSYRWLNAHQNDDPASFYKEALAYIRKNGTIPRIIASEWVRSATFISNHGELNLLLDEGQLSKTIPEKGAKLQELQVSEILKFLEKFKPRFDFALKERKSEDDDLPGHISQDLRKLKRDLVHYFRLRRSAPVWAKILDRGQELASVVKAEKSKAIVTDLANRTKRMASQLEEIAENLELVEVEIYNGASQDILWQNANPEFKELAKKMKDEDAREAREKTWNWGRFTASVEADGTEKTEIWEDELGSFKANLTDNCSSKDRYVALKFKKNI